MTSESASKTLARLLAARERAAARLDALEREQRSASEAVAQASGEVAELERREVGGEKVAGAPRRRAEETLAQARAKAAEPWGERRAGVEAAIRDANAELQRFASAHLPELVEDLERDGDVAAAELTAHAEGIVTAFRRREEIASQIGQLLSTAGIRPRPGTVSGSSAQALVAAASELVAAGGEEGPRLTRDPREPMLGAPAEPVTA
jgi:hypothetical protein